MTKPVPSKKTLAPCSLPVRVLLCCLVAGCILFIFSNSAAPGPASSGQSHQVAILVSGNNSLPAGSRLEEILRKLAHLAEYALLGFLSILCLRTFTPYLSRHFVWPCLLGLAVAAIDEAIQINTPGRTALVTDVLLDFCGVMLGTLIAAGLLAILRRIRGRRAKSN